MVSILPNIFCGSMAKGTFCSLARTLSFLSCQLLLRDLMRFQHKLQQVQYPRNAAVQQNMQDQDRDETGSFETHEDYARQKSETIHLEA